MRRAFLISAGALLAWRMAVGADGNAAGGASASLEISGQVTVVTSERLTFDYAKKYALFEGDVVVTDPQMKLMADSLEVRFDEAGQVQLISATGHVVIEQEDKRATAGRASYEVTDGRILLEDNPRVVRGRDMLEGDRIIFWRDKNKMICEPNARLVIYPQKGGMRDRILGE